MAGVEMLRMAVIGCGRIAQQKTFRSFNKKIWIL
jgi:hypothetical protein